jgi:Flp pilus assembly protein TadG
MIAARDLLRSQSGASAAEFALVLPLLLIFLFGIIDGGRWLWTYNEAEKATQEGARVAVVTNMIPSGIAAQSFVGTTVNGVTLTQGDVVPAAALGTVKCTKPSTSVTCSCATSCPGITLTPINTAGWDAIVTRMKYMMPQITDKNVAIEYRGSGLGFAGDPNGSDVAPLVTVKLGGDATALTFTPITSLSIATMNMPSFSTTLTAEDLNGTVAS